VRPFVDEIVERPVGFADGVKIDDFARRFNAGELMNTVPNLTKRTLADGIEGNERNQERKS
jgi:hypothetical protein